MLSPRSPAWYSVCYGSRNSFLPSTENVCLPRFVQPCPVPSAAQMKPPPEAAHYELQVTDQTTSRHGSRKRTGGIPISKLQLFVPRPLRKRFIRDVFFKAAPFAKPLQSDTFPCRLLPLQPQQLLLICSPGLPPNPSFTS